MVKRPTSWRLMSETYDDLLDKEGRPADIPGYTPEEDARFLAETWVKYHGVKRAKLLQCEEISEDYFRIIEEFPIVIE